MPIGMRVEAALEIVSPGRMPIGMRVEVNWFYIEMAKIKKLLHFDNGLKKCTTSLRGLFRPKAAPRKIKLNTFL